MKQEYDLSALDWTLTGWTPYLWRFRHTMETGRDVAEDAEIAAIPATVPGSVQSALRAAGLLPDWTIGLQARACEWVENRHWIYATTLPDEWYSAGQSFRLTCQGLDYSGWVFVNGREVAAFAGSFHPHVFDITAYLRDSDNTLRIVFDCPPRWLGQFGFTSQMRAWKPRFNYTWDWAPRLVQIGVWDTMTLEASDGQAFAAVRCTTGVDVAAGTGAVHIRGEVAGDQATLVRLALLDNGIAMRSEQIPIGQFEGGVTWTGLPVDLWWPNGQGAQALYTVSCQLLDGRGAVLDTVARRVGFKDVRWAPCDGAPAEADPWLCVVNGRPIFLQGVNWIPIRPNFADVTAEEYRHRLALYRDLGCNILRVTGVAVLERTIFYDRCDELGLLVWQELPLSSSGIDNWPPEDEESIAALEEIARSYAIRRRHHVSLALWCGGNELQGAPDGGTVGIGKPVDFSHPLIGRVRQVIADEDPTRRFLPTSSSGPRFSASESEFGQGLHWDVHGPWSAEGDLEAGWWTRYWRHDDALFHSEVGAPGASPVDIIRAYKGTYDEAPGTVANPLWRRTAWWIEWPEFVRATGREPHDLEEYVAWSQERQARALAIVAEACKARFPRCGGLIFWTGHDCFPCTANTSIVDVAGRPKPAALAVGAIFRRPLPAGYNLS